MYASTHGKVSMYIDTVYRILSDLFDVHSRYYRLYIRLTSSHRRCSLKRCYKNFAKFREKNCFGVSFLIKLQASVLSQPSKNDSVPLTFAVFISTPISSCSLYIFWHKSNSCIYVDLSISYYVLISLAMS